jgi:hypothetical protein
MQLVLTLLCRDEEDVIEEMITFHLSRGVDLVIATDNNSTDSTRTILANHARSGSVVLLDEPSHTHDQGPWDTRMARMAAEQYAADWVINSDADEFWWPQSGNLKSPLTNLAEDLKVLNIERFNYLPPLSTSDPKPPFYQSMKIREKQSLNCLGSLLPPKVCHRGLSQISIDDGNHAVRHAGKVIPSQAFNEIEILHFPVRSYQQFERKIRQGAEALQRNQRIANTSIGSTWRKLYQDHLLNGTLDSYFQMLHPTDSAMDALLQNGDLISDLRLQKALRRLKEYPIDLTRE